MKDPFGDREAQNYEHPIASRELILDTLRNEKKPLPAKKIAAILETSEADFDSLLKRLFAMQRDGQIIKDKNSRYSTFSESDLLAGKVIAHRDGFGFVNLASKEDDLYLSAREMRKVFDGDEVLVKIISTKRNGKSDAQIVQVTKRSTETVVGKLFIEENNARVIPENPKISHSIYIDQQYSISAEHEQIVVVEITRQPDAYRPPKGIIKEILGDLLDPGMEIEIAVRNFDIPHQWPSEVTEQAKKLKSEPEESDKSCRFDLRDLPLVTIDGEDARDFDDAVYCEKNSSGGGWRLWVAIADVSHYVGVNSALDKEAQLRATSVYFPENVIPMLPEELSNGLCSLKPAVDRLCMVCEMTVSTDGKLSDYAFYEAVMHSHARLTYTEVGRMLAEKEDPDSLIRQNYKHLTVQIDELHDLYHALKQTRLERGAINFETQETRFIFDRNRKIESIIPLVRNDAHKLIEECMLLANTATAKFLSTYNIPALYRVHEGPTEKKLNNLRQFIGERGLTLPGGEKPTPKDYQNLFEQLEGRDDSHIIQIMMLRSMVQAVYEPENKGHFGLAYDGYTHFTSPIRRYPDLLVHRAIRSVIRSDKTNSNVKRHEKQSKLKQSEIYPYDMQALVVLGEQSSMAERRADDATRDVDSWLKCEYLQEHVGQQFPGNIASIASFGFFVELEDLFVEGMVHVSNLGGDFYQYDQAKQRLIGERTHQVFNLGDKVDVIVDKVDLEERKIHLKLVNITHSDVQNKSHSRKKKPGEKRDKNAKPARSSSTKPQSSDKKKNSKKRKR